MFAWLPPVIEINGRFILDVFSENTDPPYPNLLDKKPRLLRKLSRGDQVEMSTIIIRQI